MSAATVITLPLPEGSLYEITDFLACLFDSLDACETIEQRQECEAEIRLYLEAEIRKVDAIAGYLAHCEKQMEFAAEEIKRLQARKNLFEARFDRTKRYVVEVMENQGQKKLEGRTNTFRLRQCPASVEILDETKIPEEFKISEVVTSIDKRKLKAALEAERDVPGADLCFGRNTLVRK